MSYQTSSWKHSMKKKLVVFALLITGFLFSGYTVEARETLDFATSFYPGEDEIGSIVIYDDYVVRINYKYSASNVEIEICPADMCTSLNKQEYTSNETYFDGDYTDFYVADHFELENNMEYKISVSAAFKPYPAAIQDTSSGFIETDFVYISENASSEDDEREEGNKYADEALSKSEKIAKLFREIIIPLIYLLLLVVLIVKGVLLGIDITKFSDEPEVRKEKIRAFTYFGLAIFLVAILNTVGGFVTGLFG